MAAAAMPPRGASSCVVQQRAPTASAAMAPCVAAPARVLLPPAPAPASHSLQLPRRAHGALLPPCRITNTSEEVYRAVGQKVPDGGPDEELMMPEIQVHNPELGVLENRVGKFYLQELFEDSGVDFEETAYWFHTPPGGWDTKPVKMNAAEEAPVTFADPKHEETEGRVPLSELQEGVEVVGVISDCWLYHGIQVDFGAEFDGLVPMLEESWREDGVRETLLPGTEVRARIYKLRRPGLYRWPVQLQLVEPSWINNVVPPPEHYEAPINHEWCDEQGWSIEQVCNETGRPFAPASLLLPTDHADEMIEVEKAYGFDDPDSNVYYRAPIQDYMEEEGHELIWDMVTQLQD